MKATNVLALTVAAAAAVAAVANPADKPAKGPELTAEQKVLDHFVGVWQGMVTVPKAKWNADQRRLKTETSTRRTLGGRFIETRTKLSDGNTSLTLVTYDEGKRAYRMWYFNSVGSASESTGRWDPGTKTLTLRSRDNGFTTTGKVHIIDENTTEWSSTTTDAEGTICFRVEAKDTRVKPSKKTSSR